MLKTISVVPDEKIVGNVVIQPLINHASLGKDEEISFSVSPLWSNKIESIKGTLMASGGSLAKELDIDFACEQGRSLFDVVIPRPLIHFDMNVHQCINAHSPIEGTFVLPPGLTENNVSSAKISYELSVIGGLQTPYDVWTTINGGEIGRISKDVFAGNYEYQINPSHLKYSMAGSSLNRFSINDTMPQQYVTYLSKLKVQICLKELRLKICAENQKQAEEIAETIFWIYKPPNKLNITILEPTKGLQLILGTPTTIKVKVEGNAVGDRFSTVRAKSNNSIKGFRLVNNGQYEDGIYAATWIPDYPGATRLTINASNCAAVGSKSTSIVVVDDGIIDKDLMVQKSIDPRTLSADSYEGETGTAIKYTIKLIPLGGKNLKDVKVIENLPNYMILNNSSAIDRAKIRLNHDGEKWSTTNITWDIGELDTPRFLTFEGAFRWRMPADAQHREGAPLPRSVVTYTDINGNRMVKYIPEGEIRITSGSRSSEGGEERNEEEPGFEALIAFISIISMALIPKKN
jgi:hypothetical protein